MCINSAENQREKRKSGRTQIGPSCPSMSGFQRFDCCVCGAKLRHHKKWRQCLDNSRTILMAALISINVYLYSTLHTNKLEKSASPLKKPKNTPPQQTQCILKWLCKKPTNIRKHYHKNEETSKTGQMQKKNTKKRWETRKNVSKGFKNKIIKRKNWGHKMQ